MQGVAQGKALVEAEASAAEQRGLVVSLRQETEMQAQAATEKVENKDGSCFCLCAFPIK